MRLSLPGRSPARWYFGWNIVAAAAVLTLFTVGMRMGIGPLFLPITRDLGISRSVLASIVAAGMLCYGLAMPLAGWLVERRGTRFTLLAGTALVVLSTAWAVTTHSPVGLFWSFGVLMSIGFGLTSPVALTPVISRWFLRERGRALFFLSTGSMAGIAVMTPALTLALEFMDWRAAMSWFVAAYTIVMLPVAIWVMRDQAPPNADFPAGVTPAATSAGQQAAHPQGLGVIAAMRTAPFAKITLGLFTCGFSMNLLGTHGMPMLMDHGFDAMSSSFGIGLIGLVAIAGTLMLGHVADRLPRRNILAAIYFVRGLGFFALLIVGTHWELYVAAAIGGLVWAGTIALSSAILADIYGVRLVGVLYGWAYLGHQLGATVSSWLGGWGYETFGTHWIAFGAAGTLLVLAALVSLRLPLGAQAPVARPV